MRATFTTVRVKTTKEKSQMKSIAFVAAAALTTTASASIEGFLGSSCPGGWAEFETHFGVTTMEPIVHGGATFTEVLSIPHGPGSFDFSVSHSLRRIGEGWMFWCPPHTPPEVFWNNGVDFVTHTLNMDGVYAFDAYIMPNPFSLEYFTITAYGSAGGEATVIREAHGAESAEHFGFYATGEALTTIDISGSSDWAIGDMRVALPAPGALALLGLAGLAGRRRSRVGARVGMIQFTPCAVYVKRRKHTKAIVALTGVVMPTTLASAGGVLWDNYPFGSNPDYKSSQLDQVYPFDSQLADDFQLEAGTVVKAVEWNGGFWGGSPLDVPEWNILFYADAGGKPTGGPGDPTGTAILVCNIGGGDVQAAAEADGSFTYCADLCEDFVASGEVQWIAIQAVFPYPPQWGMSQALDSIQLGETQFGFPLLGYDYWTPGSVVFGYSSDMAFRLHGTPCPGAGALAFLGLAGLVGTRRR